MGFEIRRQTTLLLLKVRRGDVFFSECGIRDVQKRQQAGRREIVGRRTAGETIEPETGRETVGPRLAVADAQDLPTAVEEFEEYFVPETLDGEEGEERGRTSFGLPRKIAGIGVG